MHSDATKLAIKEGKVRVGAGHRLSRIGLPCSLGRFGDFGVRFCHLPQEVPRLSTAHWTGRRTLRAGTLPQHEAAQDRDEEKASYQRTSRASRCCCPLTVAPPERSSAPAARKVPTAVSQSRCGTRKVRTK